MPWGDRTGPMGAGPRSGKGLGFCNGYASAGYMNNGYGYARGFGMRRGAGFGRGLGFGARRGFGAGYGYGFGYAPAAVSKEDEKSFLEGEINRLTTAIDSLKKRREELKD